MKTTLDLLSMAVDTARSERALAIEMKLAPTTLAMARMRGRLSPVVAGKLADRIGQPIAEWMALAALEAEPGVQGCEAIERLAAKVRKSYELAWLALTSATRARRPRIVARAAARNA